MTRCENLQAKATRTQLKLRAVASLEEVANFELKSGIRLPEDYVHFLTHVGNGGVNPCRLVQLQDWDAGYWSSVELDSALRKPCIITPNAEAQGDQWLKELGIEDWERKWDADEWDPLYGTIAIAEIGCGLFYSLIVNGEYFGRVFSWGDSALCPPMFAREATFTDWMEGRLDAKLAGQPVHFLDGRLR